jgi:hypothetical protein
MEIRYYLNAKTFFKETLKLRPNYTDAKKKLDECEKTLDNNKD